MRTRERTYVRKQFAFRRRFHPRIFPEAPGGAEWYVRAYYRARAAKHHGKYVLTVSFTYVRTYLRTHVLTYLRTYLGTYRTVSLTFAPPRTYRFTHVRTYVLTLTYRTYVPFHTQIVHTIPYAHLRTYVRIVSPTYVRTYVSTYGTYVRTYVQFLPRTYVRPLFHLRTHVALCFGADGDGAWRL